MDHYHLAQLHAGTLNMYNHKKAEFGFEGSHFRFWEPLSDEYQRNLAKNSPMPLVYEASDENQGSWVPMFFPGIGLAESESTWSVFQIIPLAVDKTRVIIRTKVANKSSYEFIKQSTISAGFWINKVKAKNSNEDASHPLGSADFMQEDIYVCEQLQLAMQSPEFEKGLVTFGFNPDKNEPEKTLAIVIKNHAGDSVLKGANITLTPDRDNFVYEGNVQNVVNQDMFNIRMVINESFFGAGNSSIEVLGSVDLLSSFLQQFVWGFYKAEPMWCSWLDNSSCIILMSYIPVAIHE
ncbi:RHO alpha subunit C-terminal catalytic domain-containing protein [Psychrobium sp. nBUS_13]|uniref:RHO alpha subunit C-terminal catalytic domain-containing protein n=1 Tax=Psychrobium sp. nBUS_13 TaxID=3395319 RepID=UPI003EB8E0E9